MAFELFQPEEQLAVKLLAQAVHEFEVVVADCRLARFEPLNMVAANAFAHRLRLAAADPCRCQRTLCFPPAALVGQLVGHITGKERTLHRPAALGQVVDDRRERQGSDSEGIPQESRVC